MHKKAFSLIFLLTAAAFSAAVCAGCSDKKEKRIVIWTNNSEFASYIELFNEQHKTKAVLVYKENPAASLPPANDELKPDVIAGPLLGTEKTKRYFEPIDYLFDRKYISSSDFYPMLLKSGEFSSRQYLLPVSFNLPAVIFSTDNEELIEDDYMLSLDQLRRTGAAYSRKDKNGVYTRIGFAVQSNYDFLYLTAKMFGTNFREYRNSLTWNNTALNESIKYMNDWIETENTSSRAERDFVYKYLSMPDYKQVTSGRTLFAYTTSDKLFQLSSNQLAKIDFRWLQHHKLIPIEDSLVMIGISRKSDNQAGASEFISWLFNEETQLAILERKEKMDLDTNKFGIAGGFSSIKDINEHSLPAYYTTLLSNIPQAGSFAVPEKYPVLWEDIKSNVIIPYITDSLQNEDDKKTVSIEERLAEWKKQSFN